MKIIFLNTWHGKLQAELRSFVQRNRKDTDVFCFQEADSENRAIYEELLTPDYTLHETKRIEESGLYYTNATFIHKSLKIIETGELFVVQSDGLNTGLANYATVLYEAKAVTICNVHGAPHPGHKIDTPSRLYQTDTLIKTFENHESVIIGGDFNLLPETKSVKAFAENGYRNLIEDYEIKTTRTHYSFDRYPDNIQYYADYIFTSPSVTVTDFKVSESIVSDHLPLEVYIT